jgi:hypothetical protein
VETKYIKLLEGNTNDEGELLDSDRMMLTDTQYEKLFNEHNIAPKASHLIKKLR